MVNLKLCILHQAFEKVCFCLISIYPMNIKLKSSLFDEKNQFTMRIVYTVGNFLIQNFLEIYEEICSAYWTFATGIKKCHSQIK